MAGMPIGKLQILKAAMRSYKNRFPCFVQFKCINSFSVTDNLRDEGYTQDRRRPKEERRRSTGVEEANTRQSTHAT